MSIKLSLGRSRLMTFFAENIKECENGCHEWLRCKDTKKYGRIVTRDTGKRLVTVSAHELAFVLYHKRQPYGELHHKCKNKSCVNPEHLVDISRLRHKRLHNKLKRGLYES